MLHPAQCERLAEKARFEAQSAAWDALRPVAVEEGEEEDEGATSTAPGSAVDTPSVPAVEAFLAQRLLPLAQKDASHYNENRPLGDAIQEAVARAEIAASWPEELRVLATMVSAEGDATVIINDLVRQVVQTAASFAGDVPPILYLLPNRCIARVRASCRWEPSPR